MTQTCSVSLNQLVFSWKKTNTLLNIDSLTLHKGEQVFVQGPSGSGKSTLLNLLGGVVLPHSGEVSLLGTPLSTLSQRKRDRFRADHIGVLFQQFNLLPYLSVCDNLLLPCQFSKLRRARTLEEYGSLNAGAHALLEALDLAEYIHHPRPVSQLSIGQQQRVAAARALIGAPEILLADEPTSALDADTRHRFMSLLLEQSRQHNTTLIFVSHDLELRHPFDRVIDLKTLNPAYRVN
ncbi:ABC transporter ATP-binding protein [Nitrincola tibetensis]|uniref:ABC transporter ATP-binding protein n=1 Tax=Nitrincola tibetensis TaxID=2219697 RepID=A0A364NK10_9GAMM|nr:ABC transporter ATP-binding protein [Nitrincola tibetensis]RAU17412.1 ABC transporter ATP-binding protein [Nitrincola tibetensis]